MLVTYRIYDPEVYHVLLSVEIWTPMDLRSVAPGVECGDVTSVKSLALCYDEPRYTMVDIIAAKRIMEVTKFLYLSGASLPDGMSGYYNVDSPSRLTTMWNHLANSAADSEMEQFLFVGCFDDPEAIYEVEENCEFQIGRLVTNVKKTGLKKCPVLKSPL